MALLTVKDVAFAYEGSTVIRGLNFEVHGGDYLCIVGENGSGKSTLMKGLLRLKQPQAGTITYGDGVLPTEIGYLPQQTAAQKDFPASVFEVVISGRQAARGIRPFYGRKDREDAEENIERLGIGGLKNRCYRELSGGQQQRVLLARALCGARRMLLLDEPVSGLDPAVTQSLYALIARINQEMGITVLMVSHDIRSAARYASKILHLQGEQLFFGTAQDYAKSSAGRYFLGEEQPHADAH